MHDNSAIYITLHILIGRPALQTTQRCFIVSITIMLHYMCACSILESSREKIKSPLGNKFVLVNSPYLKLRLSLYYFTG